MNEKSSFYENVVNNGKDDGGYLFVPQELIFMLIGETLNKEVKITKDFAIKQDRENVFRM